MAYQRTKLGDHAVDFEQLEKYRPQDRNRTVLNFLNSLFRYLDSRVGPQCLENTQNIGCQQIPNPKFQELLSTNINDNIREILSYRVGQIVDDYIDSAGNYYIPGNQQLAVEASRIAAEEIIDYVEKIAGHDSDFVQQFYDVFLPNRYSPLPVMLAYQLGFLPGALSSIGVYLDRKEPEQLFSNEWKFLLEVGFDVCAELGVENFLSSLIGSIDKLGGPEESDPRAPENIYTKEDLLNVLLFYSDCPKTYKVVQSYLDRINRIIERLVEAQALADPIRLEAILMLANNLRSALNEYLKQKKISPGLIERAKRVPQFFKKSTDPRALKLRDDLLGFNGVDGILRAESLTLEDLLRIGNSVGLNKNIFPFEFIRDIEKKLRAIEKQVQKERDIDKLQSWISLLDIQASEIGLSPNVSLQNIFEYRMAISNKINQIIDSLYSMSFEELIDLSNRLGLSDIPTNLDMFRQKIINAI